MFGRKTSQSERAFKTVPKGPAGKRCYAIGDVHGRLDLLKGLLASIADHNRQRPQRKTTIVMLGDLIDRGPDSRGVIDHLRNPPEMGASFVFLKGNHEEMLLRGLSGDSTTLTKWIGLGGDQCIKSYGVEPGSLLGQPPETVEAILTAHIPLSHIRFLEGFSDSARFGDYLFVHAGIRPGLRLEDQRPTDLRWIRKEFLSSELAHEFLVVHGHSVTTEVEQRNNRIGIDTGAYRSGILTAICIEDEKTEFLQYKGAPDPSFATRN